MHISEIQAFVAICDCGSFNYAATHLHITQPAISKRLSSLEARLGHRLFDRVGRGSVLTEAGRTYLTHARRVLMEVEDSQRALDDLGEQVSGPLRLALSHHVALHRMPPLLRQFRQEYPAVQLQIEFLGSETACQAITAGRLELAVITLPQPALPDLEAQEIWSDPMQILVATDHPLARNPAARPSDLAQYSPLLPDATTYTYRIVAQALSRYGVTLEDNRVSLVSNHLETLKMLASVGLGWTALPASMADAGLQTVSIPGLELSRSLGIVRHPRRSLSNAARAFSRLLEQQDDAEISD